MKTSQKLITDAWIMPFRPAAASDHEKRAYNRDIKRPKMRQFAQNNGLNVVEYVNVRWFADVVRCFYQTPKKEDIMKIYVVFLSDDCHGIGHYDLDAIIYADSAEEAKGKAQTVHPHYAAYDVEAIGETEEE